MSLGINFQNWIMPQNLPDMSKITSNTNWLNTGIFSMNKTDDKTTVPKELNAPYSFEAMLQFWNNNQSQVQAMFISWLASMSKEVPHVAKTENIRPYDYNKYGKTNGDKIAELDPNMQEKTMQLVDYAKNVLKKDVNINSGYRTQQEQAYLRETKPHLAAKKSAHCEGLAVDLSLAGGKDSDYAKLGDYAKSIGMRWGGDFKAQKERWHFDYNWG